MAFMQIKLALMQHYQREADKAEVDVRRRSGDMLRTFEQSFEGFARRCTAMGVGKVAAEHLIDRALDSLFRASEGCESPIERMMIGPLVLASYAGFGTMPAPIAIGGDFPLGDVLVCPQFSIGRYRLDVAVIGYSARNVKIVALECDGQDFHKDASYQLERDRFLGALRVDVVHATGSEIYRDAVGVASKVASALVTWKAAEDVAEALT